MWKVCGNMEQCIYGILKTSDGKYQKLKQQNVDTGLGLERMAMLLQGKKTPFEIEIFKPVMDKLEELEK